jgi:outer membrane protein OmpA-like peptidoglycan-associated protein
MNRYTSGLFGPGRGPDPLEAFDSLYKREKSARLMNRYGKSRRQPEAPAKDEAIPVAEQSAPEPVGRVVLKERIVRDWEAGPEPQAPTPGPKAAPVAAPSPPPEPESPEPKTPEPAPRPASEDPAPEADMPLIEAGSFSVQDGGSLPGEHDLDEDIDRIIEPRRPSSDGAMRDAAIEDFLAMIDKSYRPAPPPPPAGSGEVIEGESFDVDPIDVVADVAEMSESATPPELKPDITPISLPGAAVESAAQSHYARGANAISAIGLGLAVFKAFQAEVTSGSVSVSAQPSRYVHANTPPDSRFIEVVSDFVFEVYHPRVGFDAQKFKIRIRTEIDGHDIRHAKLSLVASESDDLIASSFNVSFTASALSLPKNTMCKIRYDFSGKWDPKGSGEYDFNGMIDLWADGSVHFTQLVSEFDSPTFSSKRIQAVRIVSTKRVSEKRLKGMIRSTRDHTVHFEKPKQSSLSDDQARALKAFVDGIPKDDRDLVNQGRVPVVVEGFASTKGSASDNQKLARARRDTVVAFLKDHIGTEAVFTGKAHGELAADGPDDTESAENRKATVRIFTFRNE